MMMDGQRHPPTRQIEDWLQIAWHAAWLRCLEALSFEQITGLLYLRNRVRRGLLNDDVSTPDLERLRFYRWLYATGRLNDDLPYGGMWREVA